MRGCKLDPHVRQNRILLNTVTGLVHVAEAELGAGMALLGSLAVQLRGFCIISPCLFVIVAEVELGEGVYIFFS